MWVSEFSGFTLNPKPYTLIPRPKLLAQQLKPSTRTPEKFEKAKGFRVERSFARKLLKALVMFWGKEVRPNTQGVLGGIYQDFWGIPKPYTVFLVEVA